MQILYIFCITRFFQIKNYLNIENRNNPFKIYYIYLVFTNINFLILHKKVSLKWDGGGAWRHKVITMTYPIERFLFECRQTKTKVITLTNYNKRKQRNEPIRIRSKCMQPAPSAGKRVRPCHDWFWFSFPLAEKVARVLLTNHKVCPSWIMQGNIKVCKCNAIKLSIIASGQRVGWNGLKLEKC